MDTLNTLISLIAIIGVIAYLLLVSHAVARSFKRNISIRSKFFQIELSLDGHLSRGEAKTIIHEIKKTDNFTSGSQ